MSDNCGDNEVKELHDPSKRGRDQPPDRRQVIVTAMLFQPVGLHDVRKGGLLYKSG